MPRFKGDKPRPRPWQAGARQDGIYLSLGCYATREEAEEAERAYWRSQGFESGKDWRARILAQTTRSGALGDSAGGSAS